MATWSAQEKAEFRKAHPVRMPERQPNHNYPHADVKGYFNGIFNTDHADQKGMVTIVASDRANNTMRTVGVVPADLLGEWTAQMHVSPKLDYYFSKAQHSGNATWGNEGVFAYNAIFVDLDAHGSEVKESGQNMLDYLCLGLGFNGKSAPNFIEGSGRGYHLVWLIGQVPAELGWMVKAVSQHYAETIKSILNDGHYDDFRVDASYASNISGLTRIPGTYNTVAGTYSTLDCVHTERLDLPREYECIPAQTSGGAPRNFGTNDIGQKRLQSLLKLAEIRPDTDKRDLHCFYVFQAAQMAGMTNCDALKLVHNVNKTFVHPLGERELEGYMATAARKRYRARNNTIIEALDITEDEQQVIGLFPTAGKRDTNRARDARVAARKAQRDKKIMRQHLLGLTVSAIARKVGHAYNTVRSVIAKYSNNLTALFSAREIRYLTKQRVRQLVAQMHANTEPDLSDCPVFKIGSANYSAYTTWVWTNVDNAGNHSRIADGTHVPWGQCAHFRFRASQRDDLTPQSMTV